MLLSCGDALIDFMPTPARNGEPALRPVVGGSCLNVAVGLARLGAESGYVGAISTDAFGDQIAAHAMASDVAMIYAERRDAPSTIAFAHHDGGDVSYSFYDSGSAMQGWRYRTGLIDFPAVDAVHVGSTTLINEQSAREVLALLQDVPPDKVTLLDPNCRPALVNDKPAYCARVRAIMRGMTIVRLSDIDAAYLYGEICHDALADQLLADGVELVVVTRGSHGVRAWHGKAGRLEIPAQPVDVVDTVGAGDSFTAGLLVGIQAYERMSKAALADLTANELAQVLLLGSTCAALTCAKEGADPPRRRELPIPLRQLLGNRL